MTATEQLTIVMTELVKLKDMLNETANEMKSTNTQMIATRNVVVAENKIKDFLRFNFDYSENFNSVENAAWFTGCSYADKFNETRNDEK